MKKLSALLISVILISLLFSSCTWSEGLSELFRNTNAETTDKRLEQILSAIENKDEDAMKLIFSKKALSEAEDFDEAMQQLFSFFQGDIKSWDFSDFCPITGLNLLYPTIFAICNQPPFHILP